MDRRAPDAAAAEFDAMVELCVAAGESVMRHGTPEMRLAAQLLLYELGLEIGRRESSGAAPAPAAWRGRDGGAPF